ncbi:MAG: hypothetical protein LBL17_01805 [Coxiellaceae bacterium]|jgi:hypothetical protein|nr:hypothetical protein [Coxiellaceae bacterium]
MSNKSKLIILSLVVTFGLVGCSKEEENVATLEQPVGTMASVASDITTIGNQVTPVQTVPPQQIQQVQVEQNAPLQPVQPVVLPQTVPVQNEQSPVITGVAEQQNSQSDVQVLPLQPVQNVNNEPAQTQIMPVTTTDVPVEVPVQTLNN